jgi:hypothetical protein
MPDLERLPLIDSYATRLLESRWVALDEACADRKLRYPGVYILAFSERALAGKQIKVSDVFYIGMSTARLGVQQRLRQFKAGIERNCCHSGAMRFYREHANDRPFSKLQGDRGFYAAALVTQCERQSPADWRHMGHVACLEYYAIARVLEKTGKVPPLNLAKDPIPRAVPE